MCCGTLRYDCADTDLTYVNIYLAVILENQIQLMQNQNINVRDQTRTQE